MKKKAKNKSPEEKARDRAWLLQSRFIRSSRADFAGYTECYTCRKKFQWKEMDAGHLFHQVLDFDLENLKPQCTQCNYWKKGNLTRYTTRFIEENGIDVYRKLERKAGRAKKGVKHSIKYYERIIKKYAKYGSTS